MSAVNLLSSLKEKPNDEKQKDGSNQQGHEENGVSSGGGDPAVLAVGPARKPLTYTREELMKLRNSPLVKRNLEKAFVGCDALALVLKKRSESPNEDDRGTKGDAPNENHNNSNSNKGVYGRGGRAADPRERVRRESEASAGGIVLSPQRRSFTSGCGAPAPRAASPAPAPPGNAPNAHAHQKTEQAGRRIGSGRIMVREAGGVGGAGGPGGAAWEEPEYRPEPYRPPRERQNADRYERRSFGRDSYPSDLKRERDDRFNNDKIRDRDEPRRNNRYNQRRYDKEEEPEWFSGGPTSQLETIELRGFDDPPKKNGTASEKETDKRSNSGGSRSPSERWRETSSPLSQPTIDSVNTSNDKDSGVESKTEDVHQNNDQPEFNLDEFLKFDTIPDVLTNGGSETEGGSRFSQWFRRESPTNDKHYERLLHNIVDELESPPPREAVFAPIAPAAPPRAPPSLLDLLLRANDARPEATSIGGKVHSLEELEARLRPQPVQHHNVPDHDLTAFKRLLAQVSGGHAVAAGDPPRHQPMTLLQMLNKSMEQQQQHQQQQQQQQQQKAQQQQQQQPHIPQELLYKLLQVQQLTNTDEHPAHTMRPQQPPDLPAHGAVITPSDRELLQRPEAQAIVHGLKAGEITVQHLMQQLSNPGLQSRHREILLTILRLHHQQRQMSSPLPCGAHLAPPPHQPLRLSPLPHQASGPARIPSPRELAAHTQSIMHSALIKKKLEEQRENYRRRHEMQQLQQQQQQQHVKQSTPISFTPTSVLRKMTAEKESDSPSPKQWQSNKIPQGRPIVKGNQSGPVPMNYNPVSNDYQHYMNQQQQMPGGVRQFPLQQQRQQGPNTYNNMNNMNRGMSGGTTLHQLLVQSHQRSMNELGGGGAAGGDNQLARWFSPELLARASAGKLPSVHVPNALSLEELERHHAPTPPARN